MIVYRVMANIICTNGSHKDHAKLRGSLNGA